MVEQQKLFRLLQLIKHLKSHRRRTLNQLADILEISPRTVYRYLELLQEVGYLVDQDMGGRPFIFHDQEESDHMFTPQEAKLVNDLLAGAEKHPLTESIRKKLYQTSELSALPDNLIKVHTGMVVRKLAEAIESKKQVILKKYESASSETIADRVVEPLLLTENYSMLSAYEKSTKQVKIYKIERISGIESLEDPCTYVAKMPIQVPDAFGMVGGEKIQVKLLLSQRAAMLMREEFPLTIPCLHFDKEEAKWVYTGVVKDFKGVGRFILGLPGEVKIKGPDSLMIYVRKMVDLIMPSTLESGI